MSKKKTSLIDAPPTVDIDIEKRSLKDENIISDLLGVSRDMLRADRYGPKHIPFIKFGRRILYDPMLVSRALQKMVRGGNSLGGNKHGSAN